MHNKVFTLCNTQTYKVDKFKKCAIYAKQEQKQKKKKNINE